MTKEESLYQVKLILESLDYEDYKKIPDETLDYIRDNMEYNENITIDPDKPLEEQAIDEKTYDFLEKIVKQIESSSRINVEDEDEISKSQYTIYDLNKDELIELVEKYERENSKISQIKDLINEYKNIMKQNVNEIEKLKKSNNELYSKINKCPKIIRKIFFKEFDNKLLG